jgi:hypothetical protein
MMNPGRTAARAPEMRRNTLKVRLEKDNAENTADAKRDQQKHPVLIQPKLLVGLVTHANPPMELRWFDAT